ncbi:sulfotransferase [Streptomyces sp. HNM0574]|uniref:sulfotransferase n=1 Tax=Streptomyces sp. HNM0574 TaxID=2714954 RepID=UPI001469D9CD|nr:sulfotransferase [Streptomyces sp. HNM0574]NLU69001.1 sulfotransferase [Streptomyces sp. HNM0574]
MAGQGNGTAGPAPAFVVGTGRSGSTALSRVLRAHPQVLSLNELFACMPGEALRGPALGGPEFWRFLREPNALFDSMIRSGAPLPEFLYNRLTGTRYSAHTTGIPALSLMTLPHLTDEPDALLDALEPVVTAWPVRPPAAHWAALFAELADRLGGRRVAVERSGYSLGRVATLHAAFPEARFVHLYRDGPDCALSMSRHPGYRMIALQRDILARCGLDSPSELTPEHVAGLPEDLAALLRPEFDPALVLERPMPVAEFGALWSELVAEGTEALRAVPAPLRTGLGYERLLESPHDELARLAVFVGVDPVPQWLEAGADHLDGTGRRGSALRLDPAELELLRERCAPGVRALAVA